MSVRAKFRVGKIEDSAWNEGREDEKKVRTVNLFPVCDGSPENKSFFAATPGGQIQLGCANLSAAAGFELGQEFYVDFTPAEE